MAVAEHEQESSGSSLLWIILVGVGMAILCSMASVPEGMMEQTANPPQVAAPSVQEASVNRHAVERHGDDAIIAADWVSRQGPSCCYACADGRMRCACPMPDGRYAVAVFEGNAMVTAFLSRSENYIHNMLRDRGCRR